ncbi:MAG: T9SS type A sorting domain-containing protein, partial [Phaeodactylibacter sp.]|nr:T9SS type A sorting domain-containing protein [Phaeodactylibacter sp.]
YSIDGGQSFHTNWGHHNLAGGSYEAVVVDLENCTWTATIELETCFLSGTTAVTAASQAGLSDGSLLLNGIDGNGDLLYKVEGFGDFQSDPLFENLPAGDYQVYIQDALGCEWTQTVTIPVCALGATVTVVPSNTSVPTGKILFMVSDALGQASYSIDGGQNFQTSPLFNNLAPGSYDLVILDEFGCVWTSTATIGTLSVIAEVESAGTTTESTADSENTAHLSSTYSIPAREVPLQCWPNPASETLNLKWATSTSLEGAVTIQVLDVHGRILQSRMATAQALNEALQLDLSRLVPGTYLIQVEGQGVLAAQKICIF